jgi:quercetin dioxygenase-like cupin family protein
MLQAPDLELPSSTVFLGAHRFRWLATAASTGGSFSCAEITARRGTEPPPHAHSLEDQAFFVLDGEITFMVGEAEHHAHPGGFVWAPRGVPHGFTIHSETATMLEMSTPGGLEDAFLALSDADDGAELAPPAGPPDPAQLDTLVSTFGRRGVAFRMPDGV